MKSMSFFWTILGLASGCSYFDGADTYEETTEGTQCHAEIRPQEPQSMDVQFEVEFFGNPVHAATEVKRYKLKIGAYYFEKYSEAMAEHFILRDETESVDISLNDGGTAVRIQSQGGSHGGSEGENPGESLDQTYGCETSTKGEGYTTNCKGSFTKVVQEVLDFHLYMLTVKESDTGDVTPKNFCWTDGYAASQITVTPGDGGLACKYSVGGHGVFTIELRPSPSSETGLEARWDRAEPINCVPFLHRATETRD